MLKRIPTSELRLGMHLHELCGSWMDHPFWHTDFLLTESADLERVHASGIGEVWIDTTKGLDVAGGSVAATAEQDDVEIDQALQRAADTPVDARRSLLDELHSARRIVFDARPQVMSMFAEARLGNAADIRTAHALVERIHESVNRNPQALISIARLKDADEYTFMHSVAVSGLMIALARRLGFDDTRTQEAGLAGLLHDLGKAKVPNGILNKPGALTDAEFSTIKRHPEIGYELLAAGGTASAEVMDACLHHHERVDGTGYPHRLPHGEISLVARMTAVCDVYDAITSNRPYKAGWNPADAVRKMAAWSKSHFDDAIFQAFVRTVGIYPVGSLVRMASQRLAVVIEQSPANLTLPKVKLFYSLRSQLRIAPEVLDLSRADTRDRIAAREDPAQWNFADLDDLWQHA